MEANVANQKILALADDQEFMQFLFAQDTYEKIQAAFASKGIEFSIDEVAQLVATVLTQAENGNTELNEHELEDVAGGFLSVTAAAFLAKMAVVGGMTILGGIIGWKLAGKK